MEKKQVRYIVIYIEDCTIDDLEDEYAKAILILKAFQCKTFFQGKILPITGEMPVRRDNAMTFHALYLFYIAILLTLNEGDVNGKNKQKRHPLTHQTVIY